MVIMANVSYGYPPVLISKVWNDRPHERTEACVQGSTYRSLVMTATLSNIAVRLVVDRARLTSALNRTHIVQRGIGSNVDHHHHLATLTVQTAQMSLSCPLTFDVVDGLQCDVALGTDWFE